MSVFKRTNTIAYRKKLNFALKNFSFRAKQGMSKLVTYHKIH